MVKFTASDWSRHFDENYQAHYWFNAVSGESFWNEEEIITEDVIATSLREQGGQVEQQQQQHQQKIKDLHETAEHERSDQQELPNSTTTLGNSQNSSTEQRRRDIASTETHASVTDDEILDRSSSASISMNPLLGVASSSASLEPEFGPTKVLTDTGARAVHHSLPDADDSGLRDYSDVDDDSDDVDGADDVENGGSMRIGRPTGRYGVTAEGTRDDSDMSSDEDQLRPSNITDTKRVYADTQRDVFYYSVCVFINAVLLEGPLAAVEALLRSIVFLLLVAVTLLISVTLYRKCGTELVWACLREFLLCVAAFVSLCVPGMSCLVYRSYVVQDETQWRLDPVPTILGWVDARRFFVLSFGNGSFANNVQPQDDSDGSTTALNTTKNSESVATETGSSLEEPQGRLKRHSRRPAKGKIKRWRGEKCLDSWQGGRRGLRSSYEAMLCVPRRIQSQIIRIVRGDDDALEIFTMGGS